MKFVLFILTINLDSYKDLRTPTKKQKKSVKNEKITRKTKCTVHFFLFSHVWTDLCKKKIDLNRLENEVCIVHFNNLFGFI